VADGYGQNCVHRFTKSGEYVGTINSEEAQVGAFNCPHAIFVDKRKSGPELYVADRGNGRVQVYDLEGNFKRVFGSDIFPTQAASPPTAVTWSSPILAPGSPSST
jgi:hypothetical protein